MTGALSKALSPLAPGVGDEEFTRVAGRRDQRSEERAIQSLRRRGAAASSLPFFWQYQPVNLSDSRQSPKRKVKIRLVAALDRGSSGRAYSETEAVW
jgi:hypothetical protein